MDQNTPCDTDGASIVSKDFVRRKRLSSTQLSVAGTAGLLFFLLVALQPSSAVRSANQPPLALPSYSHAIGVVNSVYAGGDAPFLPQARDAPAGSAVSETDIKSDMAMHDTRTALNVVACHSRGPRMYYDVPTGVCRSLISGDGRWEWARAPEPTDPTLVPVLSALLPHLSNAPLPSVPIAPYQRVEERFAPSRDSRWLLDDWRLWEGELPCSNRAELRGLATPHTGIYARTADGRIDAINRTGDPPPPADADPRHAPFATVAAHKAHLPNSLYEIEHACIDEASGRLLTFAAARSAAGNAAGVAVNSPLVAPLIAPFEGLSEHPYGLPLSGMRRFLAEANRELVPIRLPKGMTEATASSPPSAWRDVVAASLEEYLAPVGGSASVMFVEDPALMFVLGAAESTNPAHMFQRVAAASSLQRLLGARSLLFLADYVSLSATRAYASLYALNANASGIPLSDLLPPELSMVGRAPAQVERRRPPQRRRPVDMKWAQVTTASHLPVEWMAASIAIGTLVPDATPVAVAHPLHMSGERSCETMRCAGAAGTAFPPSSLADVGASLARGEMPSDRHCPAEEVADLRRCGRRHIAVNVAPPIPYHHGLFADSDGRTSAAWNAAVKEAIREGRRLRRDVAVAREAMLRADVVPPPPEPPSQEPGSGTSHAERREWYLALWRARLVHVLGGRALGAAAWRNASAVYARTSDEPDRAFLGAYLYEYIAALLESGTEAEAAIGPPPTRRLVCYRTIAVSHNHYRQAGQSQHRGELSAAAVPTQYDAEGLKNVYEATAARFAACPVSVPAAPSPPFNSQTPSPLTEDHTQANNTNRDAHPLFTLPPAAQGALADAFASSQMAVEAALQSAVSGGAANEGLLSALQSDEPLVALRGRVPALRVLLGEVADAMRVYDVALMRHFTANGHGGRPIAVYHAARLTKRALVKTNALFVAEAAQGGESMGSYVDFATHEGMRPARPAPGSPSPRAEQYRRVLEADVLVGPHGADLNAVSYLKPSALALEIGIAKFNTGPFASGWFSGGAYARGVGYLRVTGHTLFHNRQVERERYSTYLTRSEWRHSLSTAVCAWLAMNAVRLADEANATNALPNATNASALGPGALGHLVPWWCRGGALGAVDALRERLHSASNATNRTTSASHMKASAGTKESLHVSESVRDIAAFLERRAENSGFGFSVPQCPPLALAVHFVGRGAVRLVTGVGQAALNRLQTECARPLTRMSREAPASQPLRAIGALQSALEVTLGLDERRAGAVAAVVIHGSRDVLLTNLTKIGATSPPQAAVTVGPCGHSHNQWDVPCVSLLLQVLVRLAGHGSSSPHGEIDPSFLPAVARALYTNALAQIPSPAGATFTVQPTQSYYPPPDVAIAAYLMRSLAGTRFDMDFLRGVYPRDEAPAFSFGGDLARRVATMEWHPPKRRRSRRR